MDAFALLLPLIGGKEVDKQQETAEKQRAADAAVSAVTRNFAAVRMSTGMTPEEAINAAVKTAGGKRRSPARRRKAESNMSLQAWQNALSEGKKVGVEIKINYNNTNRPINFEVTYYINNKRTKKIFTN